MSKPTVDRVAPIVAQYYCDERGGCAGGSLHIVLDDGNVSDDDVRFCVKWAHERGDADGLALANVLLRMSKTQRTRLYNDPQKRAAWFEPDCDISTECAKLLAEADKP